MSGPVDEPSLVDWLAETRTWADAQMEQALSELDLGPAVHGEALRYALMGPGKRLRPALVRLICNQLGGRDADAAPAAVAIEMLHTYSLVHDDLPCMDDDDLRRSRPTVHKVYGEAEAVLVGDGLQSLAFEWLARAARSAEQVAILARAAGPAGMVGGQSMDLAATGRGDALDADEVRRIHASKTAALIAAAVEMGAVAGDASAEQRAGLARYGLGLGLCFQAVDDLLDVTGDASTLGKTPGKDEAAQKATLVATLGLDGAREEARSLAQETREAALEVGCPEGGLALALVDHLLDRTR
jgi:geranylgeranyl pyrophosphate synthase